MAIYYIRKAVNSIRKAVLADRYNPIAVITLSPTLLHFSYILVNDLLKRKKDYFYLEIINYNHSYTQFRLD